MVKPQFQKSKCPRHLFDLRIDHIKIVVCQHILQRTNLFHHLCDFIICRICHALIDFVDVLLHIKQI